MVQRERTDEARPGLVQIQVGQEAVLESEHVTMSWDFEYNMRKESTARRPDVTIEYKERKVYIW